MYETQKVLCPLSGGINSAAVLCWLKEQGHRPAELHLYYAHLVEHSPDTLRFVGACMRFARQHFPNVKTKITRASVLEFFESIKMIPHPTRGFCTEKLKIEPMETYSFENGIQVDLVGYVREEAKRIKKARACNINTLFTVKEFPIELFTDEWCFDIVDRNIGWHPAIYDLRDANGKRLFSHNNCLPCKNMHIPQMLHVATHFPEYMRAAQALSVTLDSYWGRDADKYYTAFGREDYEPSQCQHCAFD